MKTSANSPNFLRLGRLAIPGVATPSVATLSVATQRVATPSAAMLHASAIIAPAMIAAAMLAACGAQQTSGIDTTDTFGQMIEENTPEETEASPEENREALEELMERARANQASAPAQSQASAEPEEEVVRGLSMSDASSTISRGTLRAFHAKGPHAVLGAVEIEPFRLNETPVGYELLRFLDGSEFLTAGGFMPGDVIRRVNGRTVLSADAFMEVWDELPEATSVSVDLIRAQEELTWTWQVVD